MVNKRKAIMKSIMKTMLAVAAIFTVATAGAQPPRGGDHTPKDRAKHMSERMAEKLDLNDTQKQQIYDLHKEFIAEQAERPERPARRERGERPGEEEMEAIKEARKTMMEERKAKMEEMDSKIKTILTPEQYEKWAETKAKAPRPEAGPRMHDNGRGAHPGQPADHRHDNRRHRRDKDGATKQKECSTDCDCKSKE